MRCAIFAKKNQMKYCLCVLLTICCISGVAFSQEKIPAIDKSPLDISYFPVNFPLMKVQEKTSENLIARIIYSRPSMNGRKVFGELIAFEKLWRLGANEATEIEFFTDVYINKTKVKKGRYSIYAIPTPTKWTIIINKALDTWGAFNYNASKDVIRVAVDVEYISQPVESFSAIFDSINPKTVGLQFFWENAKVILPITLTKPLSS